MFFLANLSCNNFLYKMSNLYLNWVLLSVSLIVSLGTFNQINCDYQAYLTKFEKDYDEQEKARRKPIFQANCAQLQRIEEEANGAYHVACNRFTDRDESEKQELFRTPKKVEDLRVGSSKVGAYIHGLDTQQPAAASLDYRNYNGKNYVTSAKNQGGCGSCWSFTTASFFQSYYLLKGGSGTPDYSEQYILECSGAGTCKDGGYTQLSIQFGLVAGMVSQKSMPYEGSAQGISVSDCSKLNKIFLPTDQYPYFRKYYYLEDQQIKSILTNYGPISVAMYASGSSFIGYSSGVYNGCPSQTTINHGALLVGYDESGNWIIKNSWGPEWGEGGFAHISKDYNCGIDTYADFIIFNDGTVQYSLQLRDIGSDGYNGWVFGIKNTVTNQIEFQFGRNFTSGSQLNLTGIQIKLNQSYEIVVVEEGESQNKLQCSFILKNQEGNVVYYMASRTDFISPIAQFCPDCHSLQFVPVSGSGSSTSNEDTYKLLMFVFIGVAAMLLIITVSLALIICRLKRSARRIAEKYHEQKKQNYQITQGSGNHPYGWDSESGKNAFGGNMQAPLKNHQQLPHKSKPPLMLGPFQDKSNSKGKSKSKNNHVPYLESENSAGYLDNQKKI